MTIVFFKKKIPFMKVISLKIIVRDLSSISVHRKKIDMCVYCNYHPIPKNTFTRGIFHMKLLHENIISWRSILLQQGTLSKAMGPLPPFAFEPSGFLFAG